MFFAILGIYLFTLLGNTLIVSLVCLSPRLQNPMYFFLGNFSFLEICYTSVIVPQTLVHILAKRKAISYTGCLLQLFFCSSFGCTECLLLSTMAYDRYLAICHPLRYSSLMRSSVCIHLTVFSWAAGLLGSFLPLLMVTRLLFCGPNHINHFFCEALSLFPLSCTDICTSQLSMFLFASAVVLGSSLLIVASYAAILCAILRTPSSTGKQKAFQTCASHLMVVSLFYGTLIFTYVASPAGSTSGLNKGLSLLYIVVTPMLNPIIYSLRNSEIHNVMGSTVNRIIDCKFT
ncbi:hypothetical protein FKM82_005209 [Ascaphus truei]